VPVPALASEPVAHLDHLGCLDQVLGCSSRALTRLPGRTNLHAFC
jgi:hypothetical protein